MIRSPAALVILLLAGITALTPGAFAEVLTTVTVDAYQSVTTDGEETTAAGVGRSEIDFESRGSRDVRSRLQLRGYLTETDGVSTSEITIPRAEIRWRLAAGESYRMRFTVGRSRLSWGDGVLFNAGDTINGARPGAVDLTADTLRDETQWLTAGYFPLGRFAFLEPVLLLPGYDMEYSSGSTGRTADDIDDTAAGGRLQFNLFSVKSEIGYLYRGEERIHQPSIALQGNLGVDWYAGVSMRLPDPPDEELYLSGGLVHHGSGHRIGSWSLRVESLWEQKGDRLHLYPEVTWSPSRLFSVFLRGTATPVVAAEWLEPGDTDASGAVGLAWTPTTGLTISLYTVGTADRGTPGRTGIDGWGGPPETGTTGANAGDLLFTTVTAAVSYTF
ncbi:MAG: hypothetical protein ACOCYQ_00300 [Alkalispirochaeta sp.]